MHPRNTGPSGHLHAYLDEPLRPREGGLLLRLEPDDWPCLFDGQFRWLVVALLPPLLLFPARLVPLEPLDFFDMTYSLYVWVII